jgi:alpha-beta hydrolase superfamily lysophospholipase
VAEAMEATRKTRGKLSSLVIPILLLTAGHDTLVVNQPPPRNSLVRSIVFPDSRHEILMERESIRSEALRQIVDFYQANATSPR